MTLAVGTTTVLFLASAAVLLFVGVLLSRAIGGGWRPRSRDVAQPTPNRDGDATRSEAVGGPDPLTPRADRDTPEREISY